MNFNKLFYIAGAVIAVASCGKMEDMQPASGVFTQSQVQALNEQDPTRADASFSGMFTKLGKPSSVMGGTRADDWGFLMICLSNDVESADAIFPDNNYNWFSVCGEYTSRSNTYANPYIRYAAPYNTISDANGVILQFPNDKNKQAQAKAVRAFAYMNLAPFYQRRYVDAEDEPCVPIVTEETTNFTQNPRASVKEVYDLIFKDLSDAIEILSAPDAPARTDKMKIDASVAYALRARAYLTVGNYDLALLDAKEAQKGYTPASIAEVSKPSFYSISEHNWIWGYAMTTDVAKINSYATSSAWTRSFSGDGYSAATQCYLCINSLLYNKISDDDVRKGWWVNENLESPLLESVTWNGVSGQDVAYLEIENVKTQFLPYTNVKFGMKTIGETLNNDDFPFIRVEEMILIEAECLNALGRTDEAQTCLENFVGTYRQPGYAYDPSTGRSLADEIWFQRRIELWGEGFGVPDARRLAKPIVRTHGLGTSNQPSAFEFNIAANDPWLNMRFSQYETNTNLAIVDNTGGSKPTKLQNADLRDGVTD